MKPEDLVGLAVPVAFFLLWGLEAAVSRLGHGRRFEPVRGWSLVGIVFFLITAAVNVSVPVWLPPEWIARHRLMDLTALGLWGAPLGYVALSFTVYWFHRAEHRFDLAWRGMHQMHHAIERVDMPGWAVGHPLETVVFTAMLALVSTFVLGLDPLAASIAGTAGTVVVMFSHLNIPTPRWVGYVFIRPEQHCLHHERDVHARNYGDIALWDILFGTFENPRDFKGKVGFGLSSVRHMAPMLGFADVNVRRLPNQ